MKIKGKKKLKQINAYRTQDIYWTCISSLWVTDIILSFCSYLLLTEIVLPFYSYVWARYDEIQNWKCWPQDTHNTLFKCGVSSCFIIILNVFVINGYHLIWNNRKWIAVLCSLNAGWSPLDTRHCIYSEKLLLCSMCKDTQTCLCVEQRVLILQNGCESPKSNPHRVCQD